MTTDDFAYTDVTAAPDDVRLRAAQLVCVAAASGAHRSATAPSRCCRASSRPTLPGSLTEVAATAADGTAVRSWLVLPDGDGTPAPLLLWVHGGPLASWNSWHWRWNPWVLAARGYAVLLPDPALSTGYGQDFIQRGWGNWGGAPYDDLMAATDAACAHPRIDARAPPRWAARSAATWPTGWPATPTGSTPSSPTPACGRSTSSTPRPTPPTTGVREMTPRDGDANSPHRFVAEIRTPMLVIHGDKDYRVPIGEALRLWYELLTESGLPAADDGTSPHRFLYFPVREPLGALPAARQDLVPGRRSPSLASTCSVRTSSLPETLG